MKKNHPDKPRITRICPGERVEGPCQNPPCLRSVYCAGGGTGSAFLFSARSSRI